MDSTSVAVRARQAGSFYAASRPAPRRVTGLVMAAGVLGLLGWLPSASTFAYQEATTPHWIWHPDGKAGEYPEETRYFRKSFRVKEPSRLVLDATADNELSLYLDGKLVAEGNDWGTAQHVEARLGIGPHVLAARARNEAAGPAGFLLRGGVLPLGQGVPIQSDGSWRTAREVPVGEGWTGIEYNDRAWAHAVDLGALGTGPWQTVSFGDQDPAERYKVPQGFRVETVARPALTGSVVAFTFDPEGRPCVSIERGPIVRLFDDDKDGRFDRREAITPKMNNCQGLSFIHGHLFAVGNGPQGAGLYRLDDANGDSVFEKTEPIRLSRGGMGEHGPHAVALGPDGRLYYNNGNHAHLRPPIDPSSPINIEYEGELLPHYNDSRGHAAGIMAPGGEIYRSDDGGKTFKRVVAGFRNQYDFAFNRDGELFTFDSDMEWDVGLPWYRPVRVNHCALGAEFGWRNGSGKWPAYYVDSLPAAIDLGRGSPTGVTFYQADQFPSDYHDRFLICDWSQGRILAVKLKREGASYLGQADELVTGQPLNCTDIEVGPDGSVYFTTGGRGTQGGLYRLSWTKPSPPRRSDEPGWMAAVAMNTPLSSFSQKRIGEIRERSGDEWNRALPRLARDADRKHTPAERVRALELMSQFGPEPDEELLVALSTDREERVRERAIGFLGRRSSSSARQALVKALGDADPFVRRLACEGLLQQPSDEIPVAELIPLLSDPDRWIRFAARVAIEHAGPSRHRDRLLAIEKTRPRIEAMLAFIRAESLDEKTQQHLLEQQAALLRTNLAADEELDLLRVIELTYILGPKKADAAPSSGLRSLLLSRFSRDADTPANRERARLLAFLQEPRAVEAIVAHQAAVPDHAAQIHDAYCLRAIHQGWTADSKRQLWRWFETASRWDGGFSFLGYLDYMIQSLVGELDAKEKNELLAQGASYPFPTRVLVRELGLDKDTNAVSSLVSLYRELLGRREGGPQADDLRSLIMEKLGRSRDAQAHAALRQLAEVDAARLEQIARALADHPTDADLPVLVKVLASRDPNTRNLSSRALLKLKASPTGPEGLANLIRLARQSGPSSRSVLDELAARWTGTEAPASGESFENVLAAWESVYRKQFPNAPSLGEGESVMSTAYRLPQLVEQVLRGGMMRKASPKRGSEVILRARCLDCHKFGDKGAGLGPDLTTVNSRFRPAEILESIVEPSKVISDQYRSVTLATEDGKIYTGMPVVSDGAELVLLLSDGTKVTIPKSEIEEQKTATTSVMPEGLLNSLTFQEIADLLALFDSMPRVATPEAAAGKGK
jgi:putative membrane-bound dehydrogenase-like protein